MESFVSTRVEIDEVIVCVPELMSKYGLASYDAVHVGTAFQSGVRAILTVDVGFAALPEHGAELYVDRSRLTSCRRRRAR